MKYLIIAIGLVALAASTVHIGKTIIEPNEQLLIACPDYNNAFKSLGYQCRGVRR
jgi:hypothetical protein